MMLIICAVVRRLSRRAACLVDLHILCSTSYTKMFVGKDPSSTGGILYGMEVVGHTDRFGRCRDLLCGTCFRTGYGMGLGLENLWNEF